MRKFIYQKQMYHIFVSNYNGKTNNTIARVKAIAEIIRRKR